MLRTVEFGTIRIVESVDPRFDTFCGWDLLGEWSFWMLPDGEVVALEEVEQTSSSVAGGPGAVVNNLTTNFVNKLTTNFFQKSVDKFSKLQYNITTVKENRKEKNNAIM